MPRYLNTLGRSTLAIGICDRCKMKFSLEDLQDDPNVPGLKVCAKDRDQFDPWRLPARQTENITLRFARPDEPLTSNPAGTITEDGDAFIITEDGEGYILP